MTAHRPPPDGQDRLFQAIPKILQSGDPDASIVEALEVLRSGTGADAAVVFFADGDAPLREHWAPDDPAVKSALRPRLKVEALEAIRRGGCHLAVASGEARDGRVTKTVLLCAESGPLGAAALAWPAASSPGDEKTHARIVAMINLVSSAVICRGDVAKLRAQAERDKRWFKTLDDHLRVLDRERQKFAAVVNQTDTFVFVTDEERIIRWNNRAMAVLLPFGDDETSWIGRPCHEVCARIGHGSPGSDACDCAIRRAIEQNEVTHQELRPTIRGVPGVLYLTALPIKGLDGKPREAMILVQDLTNLETLRQSEIRHGAHELGESEARQGAMVEAALDAIVSMDHAGRVLEFNPAAERIFGHKRGDVLGRDMADLIIPPALRDRHRQGMEHYLATGEARILGKRMEITAVRADGTEFPIELTIARISSKGPPVFTGFIRDLTEKKSAEVALRRAENLLRTVVAESPIVVFALDRDGTYTVSSGKGLARLGRIEGEVVGRSVYDVYKDHPEVLTNIDRCFAGEEFTATVDIGTVAFEAHYTPVRNAAGEVTGLFGVATDITDRKGLEAQLRHAQKMEAVGRLAGGVAHDFNNLLTVVKGHSEVMLGKMSPSDPLRLSAEEIQKAGARGVLLTRQLLAFSRKNVTTPEVLDLADVVRDMESMLHRLIGEDVRLLMRTGAYPLRVRADRGQMEQVLANLAVNSRDAMPTGGGLVIEVSATELTGQEPESGMNLPAGPYVALTVSDEGCGMAPEVIGHLFEPFFTTKEQGKGTGLGLSVVYGIVRQSGGDIQVESSSGNGATFRILLPRVGGPEPAAPSDTTGPPALKGQGRGLILLVEDEEAVRALARDFLGVLGYEVIEANSGEEAFALFDRHRASVRAVVSDIVMPGISGLDLARRLVALKPSLKMLLVSGYAKESLTDSNFGREGFAFLQKPYTLEDFGRRLAELLSASSVGS